MRKSNQGVSEIVGALVLILIVIVAASTVAYFVSVTEKQSIDRQSLVNSVQNENLQIVSVYPYSLNGSWQSMNITVRNMNIQSSSILDIMVDGHWVNNWSTFNGNFYLNSVPLLSVPAGQTQTISLNISSCDVEPSNQLSVSVTTTYYNTFSANYNPPTPIVKMYTSQEVYGLSSRDIYTLDGSQSFASGNQSSIQAYIWQFFFPGSNIVVNDTGSVVQYRPESMLNQTELDTLNVTGPITATLTLIDSNGLTATSNNITIPEDPAIAPLGGLSLATNENEPVLINSSTGNFEVNVSDIFGRPVCNSVVTFTKLQGDSSLNITPFNQTDTNGIAGANMTWGPYSDNPYALVEAKCGNLPPLEVEVVNQRFLLNISASYNITSSTITVNVQDSLGDNLQNQYVQFLNYSGSIDFSVIGQLTDANGNASTIATGTGIVEVVCGEQSLFVPI